MKLTGAAILVSRGMKVLQAAPAAYPFRSAVNGEIMPRPRSPVILVFVFAAWLHGCAKTPAIQTEGSAVTDKATTDKPVLDERTIVVAAPVEISDILPLKSNSEGSQCAVHLRLEQRKWLVQGLDRPDQFFLLYRLFSTDTAEAIRELDPGLLEADVDRKRIGDFKQGKGVISGMLWLRRLGGASTAEIRLPLITEEKFAGELGIRTQVWALRGAGLSGGKWLPATKVVDRTVQVSE